VANAARYSQIATLPSKACSGALVFHGQLEEQGRGKKTEKARYRYGLLRLGALHVEINKKCINSRLRFYFLLSSQSSYSLSSSSSSVSELEILESLSSPVSDSDDSSSPSPSSSPSISPRTMAKPLFSDT
jgi:hypothetical protein